MFLREAASRRAAGGNNIEGCDEGLQGAVFSSALVSRSGAQLSSRLQISEAVVMIEQRHCRYGHALWRSGNHASPI
jgi:hypothetical protein